MSNMFKNAPEPGPMSSPARDFLRPHEVAQKLGVSSSLVMRHLRNRIIPGFKIGKVWLVRASELERYLNLKEALYNADDE